MAVAGTYIRFAHSAETIIEYECRSSFDHLMSSLEAWEREAKARQMFAWKEPKKRIPVPTVHLSMRYERRFTGLKFPVGGPKK